MTSEEQRMAIAKVCGWSEDEPWLDGRRCFTYKGSKCGYELDDIPDYCNDLNAMHEAEKILKHGDEAWNNGGYALYVQALPYYNTVSATAAERAEAFLRTLNLWK
jgi:hypothetical protein